LDLRLPNDPKTMTFKKTRHIVPQREKRVSLACAIQATPYHIR
jgi:hypothetical protein